MSLIDGFARPLNTARRAIVALLVMQALTLVGLGATIYMVTNAAAHCAAR